MRENIVATRKRDTTVVRTSSYYFWGFAFGVDSIFEEVGFFSFMVSLRKIYVFIVSCVLLLCMLFSQIRSQDRNSNLNDKNLTHVRSNLL